MSEQNPNEALAVIQQIPPTENAVVNWRRTTDIASLVRAVVMQSTVTIQGRKYLTVAGFQAVANAFGCVASARDVVRVEGGWQAVGEVKRMSDGMVLSTGVGFLGDDEKMWQGRPTFSKMAMAQTRACGRALRAAFAFMAPVIDGNLQTTPAEEIDAVNTGSIDPPAPVVRGNTALRNALKPNPTPPKANQPPPHTDADFRPDGAQPQAEHDRSISFVFGRDKGKSLAELSESSLTWYADAFNRDLADASKERFHAKTRGQLAAVMAELKFRGVA